MAVRDHRYTDFKNRERLICVPLEGTEHGWHWYQLPKDIFEHKEYPICKCGRKYVPLKEDPSKCFYCQFTE